MSASSAALAECRADIQSREAALKHAQASLEAQLDQLHLEQQASPAYISVTMRAQLVCLSPLIARYVIQ